MNAPVNLEDFRKTKSANIGKTQYHDCKTAIDAAISRGAVICRDAWTDTGLKLAFLYWQPQQSFPAAAFGTTIAGLVAFRSDTKSITVAGGLCALWWPENEKETPLIGQNFHLSPLDAVATDWIIVEPKNVFEGAA